VSDDRSVSILLTDQRRNDEFTQGGYFNVVMLLLNVLSHNNATVVGEDSVSVG